MKKMMRCPICKELFDKEQNGKYFPFDKKNCQLLDLYSWFEGEYCISEELPPITDYEVDLPEPFWREDD